MEILVTRLNRNHPQGLEISFSSTLGNGKAIWKSSKPRVGQKYHVEVEITETLTWGKEIVKQEGVNRDSIKHTDEGILINGSLYEVADDGCAIIRVGSSFIMAETMGSPFEQKMRVQLKIPTICFRDINL